MDILERKFEQRMQEMIQDSKSIGYNPTYFIRMIHKYGAIETCKRLVNDSRVSEGFTKLWGMGKLDLSVEKIISEDEWKQFFTKDEVEKAKKKLNDYGYKI